MSIFKREKTVEQLEEERDKAKIQADTAGYKSQVAEREAVVKQLKKQYGHNWMRLLGISRNADTPTLRSFLAGGGGKSKEVTNIQVSSETRSRLWGNLGK